MFFLFFNGKSLRSTQQKEGIYTDFVGSKRFLTGSGLTSGDCIIQVVVAIMGSHQIILPTYQRLIAS